MKTLTIRLPDVLARRIEQESTARRVSKSDIVRERLDQPALPPLQDGSLRDILEESWAAKAPTLPRRFRSPHKQKLAELIRAKKLPR
ncbi:MAG TPA: CopG family transcriptional regulator [Verrucomicrobiae bacterium]|nr:CopG family transcriptional regulator [Verrucomicrobiae bacterium]